MATRPTFQLPVSGSPLAPKAKKADLESAIQDGFDILHGEIEDLENAQFTEAPVYADQAAGLAATNDGDQFRVDESGSPNIAYSIFNNNAGSAQFVASVPAPASLSEKADKTVADALVRKTSGAISVSSNLFNKDDPDYQEGAFVRGVNGNIEATGSYDTSGPIDVEGLAYIYISTKSYLAFYDAAEDFVGGSDQADDTDSVQAVPSGAVTARASIRLSLTDKDEFYVVAGQSPLEEYVPYGGLLNGARLSGIGEQALADDAVSGRVAEFLQPTKNLFVKEDATEGFFMTASGSVSASSSYWVSDYIDVTPGQVLTAGRSFPRNVRFLAAFNGEGDVVSGSGSDSSISSYTVPSGIAQIRVSVPSSGVSSFQLEASSEETEYEPGGHKPVVPRLYIPPETITEYRPSFGQERLRRTNMKLWNLRRGIASQLNILCVGDSYTQNPYRWTGPVAQELIAAYGDGGGGWTGYAGFGGYTGPYTIGGTQPDRTNGNARPDLYPVRFGGTWASSYVGGAGPDMGYVESSQAGDVIERDVPAAPDHTALRLIWIDTADGVIRHRVDGGSWTSVNTQGAVGNVGSTDITLTGGAHTVEIEIVSGTVQLCGDNALSDADGVRLHKLGASGSRVETWQGHDATQQVAGWSLLQPDFFVLMDGTNTQTQGTAPSVWLEYMTELLDRFESAQAGVDKLVVMPAENARDPVLVPMREYARHARAEAQDRGIAFLDLQKFFGDAPSDYDSDAPLPLLNVDDIHPAEDTGYSVMSTAIYRMIAP